MKHAGFFLVGPSEQERGEAREAGVGNVRDHTGRKTPWATLTPRRKCVTSINKETRRGQGYHDGVACDERR